jgi:hypothetical protein
MKVEPGLVSVKDLLLKAHSGEWSLWLPSFQRRFVWDSVDIKAFLDSLFKGNPVGILLLWRSKNPEDSDPFAGTFSTCVVSVLMGREAVSVEIEQEYLGWGLEVSKRVWEESGRAFHVLWADTSMISNLLRPSSVDAVVTSPPYVLTSLHAGDPERRLERVGMVKLPKGRRRKIAVDLTERGRIYCEILSGERPN